MEPGKDVPHDLDVVNKYVASLLVTAPLITLVLIVVVDTGRITTSLLFSFLYNTWYIITSVIYTGQTPESGIPPSDRATRQYTKVHLDFRLRFSTLIGQIGRVSLFGAGPRR